MRDEFRPYSSSHSKVQQKIAISVDLDNVVKFGIGNDAGSLCERLGKFQCQTHAAVSLGHQIKMIVFSKIGSQVISKQGISMSLCLRGPMNGPPYCWYLHVHVLLSCFSSARLQREARA